MIRITPLLLVALFHSGILNAAQHHLDYGDQSVTLKTHFLLGTEKQEMLLRWLTTSTTALAQIYGRWPDQDWQIHVVPASAFGSQPVPYGQVNRGSPSTLTLYIDITASEEELTADWTIYHELSHLFIPYRGWGDLWFSEGLASYYQNILQRRAGLVDEKTFWSKLMAGFLRGRNYNNSANLSVAELSAEMRKTKSFMRVYWSGAWYFLTADVELRKATNGNQNLDVALGLINECCAHQSLSAAQIAARLDKETGQDIFVPLFEQVRNARAQPSFEPIFAYLGIESAGESIKLNNRAVGAAIRQNIEAGFSSGYEVPIVDR